MYADVSMTSIARNSRGSRKLDDKYGETGSMVTRSRARTAVDVLTFGSRLWSDSGRVCVPVSVCGV
jgi:hypothetical protein